MEESTDGCEVKMEDGRKFQQRENDCKICKELAIEIVGRERNKER